MKVALIQGGLGGEREVSLSTGKAFEEALKQLGVTYEVVDAQSDFPQKIAQIKPDVALLALHGKYAEDGVVQGVLEYLKIPYSGSGVLASALCMNKVSTQQLLAQNDIPIPINEILDAKQKKLKPEDIKKLKTPFVVKPAREGSSLGISIVKSPNEIQAALDAASKYDHLVLVEEYIDGMELTVPILQGRALTPIEIVPKSGFYDYENKYTAGRTDYYLPARLNKEAIETAKKMAVRTFEVMNLRTYCRVDFRLNKKNDPFVIDINTLPGCTPTSLLPKSAAKDGIEFKALIKILIDEATLDYADVT